MSRLGIRPGGRLGHIGARLGPGAGGFLHWWGTALASWLPTRWRRVLGFDRGRLLLQVDGEEVQLRLQRGDGIEDLGRVPLLPAVEDSVSTLDPLAGLLAPPVAELPRWLLLSPALAFGIGDIRWDGVTPGIVACYLFTAIVAGALGYLFWYAGIARLGIARAVIYSYLIPVFALLSAVLFLGEHISTVQLAGAAVVICGLVLTRISPVKTAR